MNTQHSVETKITETEIIISRLFNYIPEIVFDAWSKPEFLSQWFGPDGFRLTTESMDFKNDGRWKFTLHGPDGTDYKNNIRFITIDRPKLIAYKHLDEENSGIVFHVDVRFEKNDSATKMILKMTFPTNTALEDIIKFGAVEGGQQTVNRLNAFLEKQSN